MKKVLLNIVTIIISSLLSLGIGEYACRSFGLSKTWESYIGSTKLTQGLTKNLEIGYIRTPNLSYIGPRNVTMSINSNGFRDKSFIKKGKKKRIAFMGDSVTEGFGIEVDDRYSDQLENLYFDELETLNFGIGGYSNIDELETLKKHVVPLQPDIVILQICFNDFKENLKRISPKKAQRKEPKTNIKSFLQKNSALYLSIAERYNYFKLRSGRTNDIIPTQRSISDVQWHVFEETIQAMDSVCRANQIAFISTYVPLEVEVLFKDKGASLIINEKIETFCLSKKITYINTIENLKKEEDLMSLYIDDCHLSKLGNLLVEECIEKHLNKILYNKK